MVTNTESKNVSLCERIENNVDFLFDFIDSDEFNEYREKRGTKLNKKLKELSNLLFDAKDKVKEITSEFTLNGEEIEV